MSVRWGILGTANIARAAFLPALRRTTGTAYAVGSRHLDVAESFALRMDIDHAYAGYDRILTDPAVDAVYIPLPNSLHEEWTIAALNQGKHVLCEKPLAPNPAAVERILHAASAGPGYLWEAFAFPFHRQFQQVQGIIASGRIGSLRQITSAFHFRVQSAENIRWSHELGGGALNDVGCYPVHLASRWFSGPKHTTGLALTRNGVDAEVHGLVAYEDSHILELSAGMTRYFDTLTRWLGTEGQVIAQNPFHPGVGDRWFVVNGDHVESFAAADHEESFFDMVDHINRVIEGTASPLHLAQDESLITAQIMASLRTHWTMIQKQ